MSGLKPVITDILDKLATIDVENQDNLTVPIYARIWNNQLDNLQEGQSYSWPRPAAFVEIVSPATFEVIGLGFRSADIGIRIHIEHDFYNSEGTYSQDLTIFDLRDKIISAHNPDTNIQSGLSQFCPTACGPLNCVSEYQDYNHGNLYHYICEFITNFTDSKGSVLDPNDGRYTEEVIDPLDAQIEPMPKPESPAPTNDFIIP